MGKNIRTFRGKMIDMDDIRRKNEDAIAVGNMNVNARGDELDEWGKVIKSRDQVAREKNSSMSRKSSNASVISTFEDDDDMYEIKDDPNVLAKNRNKSTSTKAEIKTESKVDDKKAPPKASDKSADETDLD